MKRTEDGALSPTPGAAAQDVDVVLGGRIRQLRLAQRLSQQELGDAIGVSFQQIQKYEKGSNRISAGALLKIAGALQTNTATLLEAFGHTQGTGDVSLAHDTPLSGALLSSFVAIESPAIRASLVQLVALIADEMG